MSLRPPTQGGKKVDTSIETWDVVSLFYPPHHEFGKGGVDGDDRMGSSACKDGQNMDVNIGSSFDANYSTARQDHHRRTDTADGTASSGVDATDAHVGEEQDSFSIKFSLSQEYKDDASFAEYCVLGPCQTMSSFADHSLFPSPLPLRGAETFDFGDNAGDGSPLPMLQLSMTPSPPRATDRFESTNSADITDVKKQPSATDELRELINIGDHINRATKLHPRRFQMELVQSYSSDDFSPPKEKRLSYHPHSTPIHAGRPTQHHSPGQTIYNIASNSVDSAQSPYHPIPWRSLKDSTGVERGVSPSESHVAIETSPEFCPPRGYTRGQSRSVPETTITVTDSRRMMPCNVDPITPSPSQIRQAVSDETISPTLAPTVHHPTRLPVAPTSSSEWSSTSPCSQSHQMPWNGHSLPPALPACGPMYHHHNEIPSSSSPYHQPQSLAHNHGESEGRRLAGPGYVSEDAHWAKHQHLLHQFLLHFGHCDVPAGYGVGTHYEGLYQWCIDQRTEYQKMCRNTGGGERSSMTPERVRMLTGMGFVWGHSSSTFRQSFAPSNTIGSHEAASKSYTSWHRWMELLSDYKQQHGDVDVPLKYEPNLSLGAFVNRQRIEYRKMEHGKPSSMTQQRVDELNRLGFNWTIQENHNSWEERFNELKDFKTTNGHCNVPKIYAKNPSLGYWVNEQRFQYRRKIKGQSSCMTDDRVKALNELDFKASNTHVFPSLICAQTYIVSYISSLLYTVVPP